MDSTDRVETLPPEAEVRLVRAVAPTAIAASSNGHRSYGDMWRMSRAMSEPGFDLLLFPTVYSYVPVLTRARKIVMIHDIIAETYPRLTLPNLTARLFWKAKVGLGRKQATAIVTVSDYSRRGIMKHFNIASDRVFVVGEASDPVFRVLACPQLTPRLQSFGINPSDRMIVYVGGFSPHKNLEPLVTAFARLASQEIFSDIRLVMVGEYKKEVFHSYFETIKKQVDELAIADRVIFTGYLPDEELTVLLNLSTVLALPSLIEGFGLPAIEAAACGCSVVATAASPLPDLLREGGIYVDPARHEEIENALARVLESESLRSQMRKAGIEAARQLTWEKAARQMINLIPKVMTL
jgi:glycosyltransferase involved in cell wall biosynthesis